MKPETQSHLGVAKSTASEDWLELVRQQVGSLRYGVVQVVVQDGHVVQIEKTERVRLEKSSAERI